MMIIRPLLLCQTQSQENTGRSGNFAMVINMSPTVQLVFHLPIKWILFVCLIDCSRRRLPAWPQSPKDKNKEQEVGPSWIPILFYHFPTQVSSLWIPYLRKRCTDTTPLMKWAHPGHPRGPDIIRSSHKFVLKIPWESKRGKIIKWKSKTKANPIGATKDQTKAFKDSFSKNLPNCKTLI